MKNAHRITASLTALVLTITLTTHVTQASAAISSNCKKGRLTTLTAGKLTIATGNPAYYPWVIDDNPESGEGFEAAVAYAVAAKLGYSKSNVTWVRTTFDGAITPGPKNFDFNLQQFSITTARKKAVDFSAPYYRAPQTIVSYAGSKIAGVTGLGNSALVNAKLGAAVGTTSLQTINTVIKPKAKARVYNDNAAAVAALQNHQIDGIVVDLPTAFYLAAVEITDGLIVGQLPSGGIGDQFGLLLAKNSPITGCVSQAINALKSEGTLAQITSTWLGNTAGAPVLAAKP